MELINMLLMIIVALASVITILFVLNTAKRKNRKININNIKFYLKEYLREFNTSQFLELDSKIKSDNTFETPKTSSILGIILFICISIPLYTFIFIIPKYFLKSLEDLIFFSVLSIIFIALALIIFFIIKRAITKKIILKNNILELNDNNGEIKTYQLITTNIKYDLQTVFRGSPKEYRYINIYINNDKFTSKGYNIYDFELYIAFIIFVNLLKTDDIEKIKSLNNNDIEKLQQNYIYNAKNSSRVGE